MKEQREGNRQTKEPKKKERQKERNYEHKVMKSGAGKKWQKNTESEKVINLCTHIKLKISCRVSGVNVRAPARAC